MDSSRQAFEEINTAVDKIYQLSQNMAALAHAQFDVAERVEQGAADMEQVVQENQQDLLAINQLSKQLKALSCQLNQYVNHYRVGAVVVS